jgi:hypothetical protein
MPRQVNGKNVTLILRLRNILQPEQDNGDKH